MKLIRVEIDNYRSVKCQSGKDCIRLDSLNCLVGQNNAGKSNVLRALRFLLRGESSRPGLHFNHDTELEIEVRGYFEVEDADFKRLKIEEKRDAVRSQILPDGSFGIYRSSSDNSLKVLAMFPAEERLRPTAFLERRNSHWDEKKGGADFRDRMMEDFPEVAGYVEDGKETTKSAWERAYDSLVEDRPDDMEWVELPGPPKQGIPADLLNLLPEPLLIPAVKEVSEATKTSSRAELGALLSAVAEQIEEELDAAITQALEEVSRQLNISRDPNTGEIADERHGSVRELEATISGYLGETFGGHSIELEFPTPRSSVIFNEAELWIVEEGFQRMPLQDVGEGVKRILIFSLIRTLADIRHGRLTLLEEQDIDNDKPPYKPYIILYEEAELFLHPALQVILLEALRTLASSGDQVVYTTHSPFMVSIHDVSTVNLVQKKPEEGTSLL